MRQLSLAATLLTLAACSDPLAPAPPPPPTQPDATNSAALAVVAVGPTFKAYLPGPTPSADDHGRLVVVDAAVQANGASGHLREIDLGAGRYAAALAATTDVLVAVSVDQPFIWFIDPVTDRVTKVLDLPSEYAQWTLSDETAFMTGVVIDSAHRRAFVSVWNGFLVLDLDTRSIADNIVVAPSEGFAYDAQRNRLVAPFYHCPAPDTGTATPPPCASYRSPDGTIIEDGLNLVDLADGKIFTYVNEAAADQRFPLGQTPDTAAMDPVGGRVVIPLESLSENNVLDLATAVFDDATSTFTASAVTITSTPLTAVAIEPTSRLGLAMEELGSRVAVWDLPAITADGELTLANMPDLPGSAGAWAGHSDPHGTRAGLLGGRPVAWIMNDTRTWLARVDLLTLNQLSKATPAEVTAAATAQAVTYTAIDPAP